MQSISLVFGDCPSTLEQITNLTMQEYFMLRILLCIQLFQNSEIQSEGTKIWNNPNRPLLQIFSGKCFYASKEAKKCWWMENKANLCVCDITWRKNVFVSLRWHPSLHDLLPLFSVLTFDIWVLGANFVIHWTTADFLVVKFKYL